MTTVEALRLLYVELGGSADDVADVTIIPDMIVKIATVAANAINAVLPEVTAADNGKVLKVIDGAWDVGTDATE